MTLRKRAKAIGGFLTLLVFLSLVIADTIQSSITLTTQDKLLLLLLLGSLLGVDQLLERLPSVSWGPQDDD